jgi:hypothetical protein
MVRGILQRECLNGWRSSMDKTITKQEYIHLQVITLNSLTDKINFYDPTALTNTVKWAKELVDMVLINNGMRVE